MPSQKRPLKLVLFADSDSIRRRFSKLIFEIIADGKLEQSLPEYQIQIARCETQEQAIACLRQHLAADHSAAILLSDALVERVVDVTQSDTWTPSYWANDVADGVQGNFATVAVMTIPRRVRDIDRAVSPRCTAQQLLETLKLVADKLSYMAPPEKRQLTTSIDVRPIRKQHELLEYFKLRHRIYKIMGYLEAEIENAPTGMEVDWCDTISLHFGAYELTREGRDTLVGTARVVVGSSQLEEHSSLLAAYQRWTTALVAQDEVLRNRLTNRVLGLELPIFHSQDLSGIFRDVVLHNEVCGELSRVIVGEDYRGTGLSTRLVTTALCEAAKVGVKRMFLECLEVHEPLYRRFSFQKIEGKAGAVIGVNKTMVAMQSYPFPTAGSVVAMAGDAKVSQSV
jgi:predicted GNAT family N-acyltransferase